MSPCQGICGSISNASASARSATTASPLASASLPAEVDEAGEEGEVVVDVPPGALRDLQRLVDLT